MDNSLGWLNRIIRDEVPYALQMSVQGYSGPERVCNDDVWTALEKTNYSVLLQNGWRSYVMHMCQLNIPYIKMSVGQQRVQ